MACSKITRSAKTVGFARACGALIGTAVNLAACAHWQSHPVELTEAAASIQLMESGTAPANCRALGEISAHRGALQGPERVDIDLRNAAAAMHGNLLVVIERTTLSAKAQVHECSAPPSPPPPPPNTTVASAERIPVVRTSGSEAGAVPRASGLEDVTLDERAHELFVLGRDAYLAKRYEDALRYFRAAHQLSGRYELQFNIGQAADRLHRNAEALEAFQSFLADAPPSEHRSEIEARVAVLRGGR
jgi:tetratricopeptide (TPR) repeat protein